MSKFKVAVCAGHGGNGSTPGKRTPDGEYEWNFNDVVVRAGIAVLKANGVDVLRTDDATGKTDVGLTARTNKANAWGADVYWSAHHNALGDKWIDRGLGIETFTQVGSYPEAEKLARIVHSKYVKAMGLKDRGVKKQNLAITRQTKMPAILTEGGFMDSKVDIKVMRDNSKLKAQGEAIAEGILEYLGVKKVQKPKPAKPSSNTTKPSATKPSSSPSNSTTTTSGVGLVDWLNKQKIDSSFTNRKKLAEKHGIKNYTGTASQNTQLLNKLIGSTTTNKPKANLKVDGYWGVEFTKALQRLFNTPVDGELWGQYSGSQAAKAITGGVKFGKGGSAVIKALQRYLNNKGYKLVADGVLGKATVEAMQKYLGMKHVDGIISKPSAMVKEAQRRLNAGTF